MITKQDYPKRQLLIIQNITLAFAFGVGACAQGKTLRFLSLLQAVLIITIPRMCFTDSVSFATEDFIVVVSIVWVTGAERGHKGREKGRAFPPYFLLAPATQAVSNIVSFCSVCSLPFNFQE